MTREEIRWCPQHGYPLPCYKCGYDGSKFDSSKIGEPMPAKDIIKEHLIELFEQSGIKEPGKLADAVLWVENEDGVVIKVDRELPRYVGSDSMIDRLTKLIAEEVQQDMLDDGYVAVEPLWDYEKREPHSNIIEPLI